MKLTMFGISISLHTLPLTSDQTWLCIFLIFPFEYPKYIQILNTTPSSVNTPDRKKKHKPECWLLMFLDDWSSLLHTKMLNTQRQRNFDDSWFSLGKLWLFGWTRKWIIRICLTVRFDVKQELFRWNFTNRIFPAIFQVLSMSKDDYRNASFITSGSFDQDFPIPELIGPTEILSEDHRWNSNQFLNDSFLQLSKHFQRKTLQPFAS